MNKQMDSAIKISQLPFEMYGFYKDIFSSMDDMLRVIDENGIVVYQNKHMIDDVGDFSGKKCHSLFGNANACSTCICHSKIKSLGPLSKEVVLNKKIYSVISTALKKNPGYYVEVFRDITTNKKHENIIENQNKKMKSDLEFAKIIQSNILPKSGRYSEMISFQGLYKPADLLGGDMFDIIEIDNENIAFYIADVSGHGVTSSLVTMFVNQTLKNMKTLANKPCLALKVLMQKYMELGISNDKYFTILYCVYNKKTRMVNITNAGHNCLPILIKKIDGEISEVDTVGMPICEIYDYLACTINEFRVEVGDKLILYTDGISEARDKNGVFFAEKIESTFGKLRNIDTDTFVKSIIEMALKHSCGQVLDDMAIMGIEFL